MSETYTESNDEISLKELILLIQRYIKEILKYWWLVLIFVGLFVGLMIYKHSLHVARYSNSLTFMLNEESSSPIGAFAGLLGSVGLGGGGSSNLTKMLKLIKSRSIMKKVLMKKVVIDGKDDYFANHFIRIEEDLELYTDEEETILFQFTKDTFDRFDIMENYGLLSVYSYIIGSEDKEGIFDVSADEMSGIFYMEIVTMDDELTNEFLIALFNELDVYYVEKTIEKNQKTYDIIKGKADSLSSAIAGKEYALAQEMDQGKNLILKTSKLTKMRLEKDINILLAQFGEVVKNKELAEFSLLSLTPVIQLVDGPVYPVKGSDPSIVRAIIIGGVLGGFFSCGLILLRRIYRDIMELDNEENEVIAA